jgi:hypothetical protein
MNKSTPPSPIRRLRFALIILVSQLLLVALALAWAIHMIIIAANGRVYFVENNLAVLWSEIAITILICLFGMVVFVIQLRRLSERRRGDGAPDERRREDSRQKNLRNL